MYHWVTMVDKDEEVLVFGVSYATVYIEDNRIIHGDLISLYPEKEVSNA